MNSKYAAITPLTGRGWVLSALKAMRMLNEGYQEHQAWIDEAISFLEQAERWAGVIEAAGKVDKKKAIVLYGKMQAPGTSRLTKKELRQEATAIVLQIYALLEALPEPPEGGKVG